MLFRLKVRLEDVSGAFNALVHSFFGLLEPIVRPVDQLPEHLRSGLRVVVVLRDRERRLRSPEEVGAPHGVEAIDRVMAAVEFRPLLRVRSECLLDHLVRLRIEGRAPGFAQTGMTVAELSPKSNSKLKK